MRNLCNLTKYVNFLDIILQKQYNNRHKVERKNNLKKGNKIMTKLMKKYTNDNRKFKFAPDRKFIKVYIGGRLNGFIWNTDKVIMIDGNKIVSADFFK